MTPPILVWLRNDLRLHDHHPLHQAISGGQSILPIYCLDPRQFGQTSFGFPKTGQFRAQFLLESLADLRQSFQLRGSDLVIRVGKPEVVIPQIAQQVGALAVYYYREVTAEEIAVETALGRELTALGLGFQGFWGHTLCHPDDIPFAVAALPNLFTHFRKQVERHWQVRSPVPAPAQLPPLPEIEPGCLPTLAELNGETPTPEPRFRGGETAARARVNHYIWSADRLRIYKETRNGMLQFDDSSKLSPWLALGCLSPRWLYGEIQRYEAERVQNDSTYWLVFELLWRDYFYFVSLKYGNTLFRASGLQGIPLPWQQDLELFHAWQTGQTGYPLVDANMRELAATGYMSNRGRQNVASFLTKNLGLDWRMGAEWFESLLVDYDVCSNYGNWNYTAGVGNDARGFRFFNILKQSKDYDPEGEYVKQWLPELAVLPVSKVHEPWKLLPVEQRRWHVRLGMDYPKPVVDLFKSAQKNEALYNQAIQQAIGKQ